MQFRGSFVALATPFHPSGRFDGPSLERLVEWHIAEGTEGIVCSGATGEATCLSEADRRRILEICVKTAAGRIPILAGTGTPSTAETIRLTKQALAGGASGCLVITPFYNKPSQRGCILHYKEVAKVGLPVVVYHNPGRTQVVLRPETLAEIGAMAGIAAVKDSSGDREWVRQFRAISSLRILSGEDWLTYEILQMGGSGTISTVGNLNPRAWTKMIRLALQGNWEEARAISDRFQPLCRAIFQETNPQCVKYALGLMGKCSSTLRLPLVLPTEETKQHIKRVWLQLALPFSTAPSPGKRPVAPSGR